MDGSPDGLRMVRTAAGRTRRPVLPLRQKHVQSFGPPGEAAREPVVEQRSLLAGVDVSGDRRDHLALPSDPPPSGHAGSEGPDEFVAPLSGLAPVPSRPRAPGAAGSRSPPRRPMPACPSPSSPMAGSVPPLASSAACRARRARRHGHWPLRRAGPIRPRAVADERTRPLVATVIRLRRIAIISGSGKRPSPPPHRTPAEAPRRPPRPAADRPRHQRAGPRRDTASPARAAQRPRPSGPRCSQDHRPRRRRASRPRRFRSPQNRRHRRHRPDRSGLRRRARSAHGPARPRRHPPRAVRGSLTALYRTPVVHERCQRLVAAGPPARLARTACMRRLSTGLDNSFRYEDRRRTPVRRHGRSAAATPEDSVAAAIGAALGSRGRSGGGLAPGTGRRLRSPEAGVAGSIVPRPRVVVSGPARVAALPDRPPTCRGSEPPWPALPASRPGRARPVHVDREARAWGPAAGAGPADTTTAGLTRSYGGRAGTPRALSSSDPRGRRHPSRFARANDPRAAPSRTRAADAPSFAAATRRPRPTRIVDGHAAAGRTAPPNPPGAASPRRRRLPARLRPARGGSMSGHRRTDLAIFRTGSAERR